MALPVTPPVEPMLARLARSLPEGDGWLFEPKWDGFRCLVFRAGDDVELMSRNQRPMARYFPELVAAIRTLEERRVVLDGEIMVAVSGGFDFASLMRRLHPAASRVARLADETPAQLLVFDVLAVDGQDVGSWPFAARRGLLERLLKDASPMLRLTPQTDDRRHALPWLEHRAGSGIDGVVVKDPAARYEPGRRVMVKVKAELTADCVVGAFRPVLDERPAVASLLLGLYGNDGVLRHVGVASSFTRVRRLELVEDLLPFVTGLAGHPWAHGFNLDPSPVGRLGGAAGTWTPAMTRDWVPVRPVLVCEVAYNHFDGDRFRHLVRFKRWRPDRDAASCGFDQLQ